MSSICPICKKNNQCAMELGKDPKTCWCMTTSIPKGLLAQIPDEDRGKGCVCQECVIKYNSTHGESNE